MYDLYKFMCEEKIKCPFVNGNKHKTQEDLMTKQLLEAELKLHNCKLERVYQQLKDDTALS